MLQRVRMTAAVHTILDHLMTQVALTIRVLVIVVVLVRVIN